MMKYAPEHKTTNALCDILCDKARELVAKSVMSVVGLMLIACMVAEAKKASDSTLSAQTQEQTLTQSSNQGSMIEVREGVDYITLKTPIPNAQNSVIEVYSYACPFCFKYAKILPQIIDKIPQTTAFHLYHLEQKGDYGKLANEVFATLIVRDRRAGINTLDSKNSAFYKAKNAYFEEYHIKKNRWHSPQSADGRDEEAFLRTGLQAAGVSMEEYQQALDDSEVKELLKQWQASYDIAMIQGVPAFVVNGKYLIKTSELKSLDDLSDKITALLTR